MKSNKRNYIFLLAAFTLLIVAVAANARTERNYRCSAAKHLAIKVDSISFRDDVTRIYGHLTGRPHTSQRVDEAVLHVGAASFHAQDIDGVDFKRWFQWEEDGSIPVELDFRPMKPFKAAAIEFQTPRGADTIQINSLK